MLSPIKAIKHYGQTPALTITSGVRTGVSLVTAIVEGAARSASIDVEEGSVIKAVYCEFWIQGVTISNTATWVILKRPSDAPNPTFTEMNNLGTYTNKKNILFSGQGIAPTNGNVMNIVKGWIKIPKGKQRFGLGDKLALVVAATGTDVILCGLTTFKEYN